MAPPPDLVSSFHPTYNLAVNLVRRWTREEAHGLLAVLLRPVAGPGGLGVPGRPSSTGAWPSSSERGFIDGWRLTEAGLAPGRDLPRVGPAGGRGPPGRAVRRPGAGPLAGVVSALTFEARRAGDEPPAPRQAGGRRAPGRRRGPGRRAAGRRAPGGPAPDPAARRGTGPGGGRLGQGGTLDSVLRDADVAPGDFVRNVRQLIDLVRQMAQVAPDPAHPGRGRAGRGPAAAGGGGGRRPGRRWGPRLGPVVPS